MMVPESKVVTYLFGILAVCLIKHFAHSGKSTYIDIPISELCDAPRAANDTLCVKNVLVGPILVCITETEKVH